MSLCFPGCPHCSGVSLYDDDVPCGMCGDPIDMGGDGYEVVALEPERAAPVCRPCLGAMSVEDRLERGDFDEEVEPWL